jgi:hypothetical protein
MISAPDGDPSDVINVSLANLTPTMPNNTRRVRLTLSCGGSGVEQVRWGTLENPTLLCNTSADVTFGYSAADGLQSLPLAITIPPESAASYVQYTLIAQIVP